MKSLFRKRVGQTRQEFSSALSFSLIVHIIFFSAALLFAFRSSPRVVIPPAYQVTLVGPAGIVPEVPPASAAAPLPASVPKKAEVKKAAPKKAPPPAPKKGAMPGLAKPKAALPAEQPEAPEKQGGKGTQPAAPAPAGPPATVAVTAQQDFGFPPYLAIIRDKIERNWNPPPASKEAKARVIFKIYRSGRVIDPDLAQSSGNFYFDQAAMRAILSSSPFPPLPEGFYKEYLEFSVDLMEKE